MILLVSSEKYWSVRVKPTDKERLLLRVKGGLPPVVFRDNTGACCGRRHLQPTGVTMSQHAALQRNPGYMRRFKQQKHRPRSESSSVGQSSAAAKPRSGDMRSYKRLEHDLPRTARAHHLFGPPRALPPAPPPSAAIVAAPAAPAHAQPNPMRTAPGSTRGWTHVFVELAPKKMKPPKPGTKRPWTRAVAAKRTMIEINLNVGLEDDAGSLVHLRGVITNKLNLFRTFFLSVRRHGDEILLESIRGVQEHDVVVVYGVRRKDQVATWNAGEDRPKGMFLSTTRRVQHGGPASTKVRRRRLRVEAPRSYGNRVEASRAVVDAEAKKPRQPQRRLVEGQEYRPRHQRRLSPTSPLAPPPPPDALALLEAAIPPKESEDYYPYEEEEEDENYDDDDDDERGGGGDDDDDDDDDNDEGGNGEEDSANNAASKTRTARTDDSYRARVFSFLEEKDPKRLPEVGRSESPFLQNKDTHTHTHFLQRNMLTCRHACAQVPILLETYEGLEQELIALLVSMYGPTERERETEASEALRSMPMRQICSDDEKNDENEVDGIDGDDIDDGEASQGNNDDRTNGFQLDSPRSSDTGVGSTSSTLRQSMSSSRISLDQHRRELMQLSAEMNPPDSASPWTTMKRSVKSATVMDLAR